MDAKPTTPAVTDTPAAPEAQGSSGAPPVFVGTDGPPAPPLAAGAAFGRHAHGARAPRAPREPRSLGARLPAPLGTLAGVAAAFAYVAAVDPNEPGHYPVCPLLRFTGLYCPGCGGLRSAHAFVHGELATAFGANALAVLGYGLFAVVMAVWLIRAVRAVPMRVAISPAWWWGIGAVLALFTVVRNLPFGSALAP
ncbi:DUF2752 domain-containing protein [Streptomyces sp. NPDC048370]|uniref:DUF2752 domain-containing protein n=1 Tax=Streptomyces sp. NPDC048370 TaxID=3365540 RepID=UPI003720ACFD